MSILITWAVPEQHENIDVDVRKVIIEKQTSGIGSFVQVAEIDATSDGAAKSSSNTWVSQYEDSGGVVDDIYRIAFKDAGGHTGAYSQIGQGGYVSRFHEVMDMIRFDLGDDDPNAYQLDAIPQYKWDGAHLSVWMKWALLRFNGYGDMVTNYNWDSVPDDAIPAITEAVRNKALTAKATMETANVMGYTDGVSFDIKNRVADYTKLADAALVDFKDMTKSWKRSHRPRAIGMGSQRLPFRIMRPMSLLPGMSNVFGM